MEDINFHFKIVFQPKHKNLFNNKRRFFVGGKQLENYIGRKNAENLIQKAMNSGKDKIRYKLRENGIIDFYSK